MQRATKYDCRADNTKIYIYIFRIYCSYYIKLHENFWLLRFNNTFQKQKNNEGSNNEKIL